MRNRFQWIVALALAGAVSVASGTCATAARAATATVQVTPGVLQLINGTPGDVAFPTASLTGQDQVLTQRQSFDVSDATGTYAGWNIQATSTTFAVSGHTLSDAATTIMSAPSDAACDAGSSCALAHNSVSYPYSLPASSSLPAATEMFDAEPSSGMGSQTVVVTWSVAVPASVWLGGADDPYRATWMFTIVSGP